MVNSVAIGYAVGASICFAIAPILYKTASKNYSPISSNLIRLFFPLVALILTVWYQDLFNSLYEIETIILYYLILAGITNLALADTVYFKAINYVGVARAVTITATYPIFAIIFTGETISPRVALGILAVVMGIYLVAKEREAKLEHNSEKKDFNLVIGIGLCTATACLWGFGLALLKKALTKDISTTVVNLIRLFSAMMFQFVIMMGMKTHTDFKKLSRRDFAILSLGGIIAMYFGSLFLYEALARETATVVTPISASSPILSTIFAFIILKEHLSVKGMFGVLITVAGIIIVVLA